MAPHELGWGDTPEWEARLADLLEEEEAVKKVSPSLQTECTPAGSRFSSGDFVHVQFDGGSQDGVGVGGFVILTSEGKEVLRAGAYYGPGFTNNEAEAFALRDSLDCLDSLRRTNPALCIPVRVWGDSQLLIKHLLRQFKKPSKVRIYEAINRARELKRKWRDVAFRHTPRGFNVVADDMGRRAREAQADVVFWDAALPPDAPAN